MAISVVRIFGNLDTIIMLILIINMYIDVTVVNNQTEDQPLILQCDVTTVRNLNSRVDFVWSSNGTELRRMEGFASKSTVNNLETYADHYIIPQLSTANNNTMYKCEVTVMERQLISITGNITLNIHGKNNVLIVCKLISLCNRNKNDG